MCWFLDSDAAGKASTSERTPEMLSPVFCATVSLRSCSYVFASIQRRRYRPKAQTITELKSVIAVLFKSHDTVNFRP